MKKLTISDPENIVLGLQDEIRRNEDARYDHRLHAILLVAQGMSARAVAELLGDGPRTVAYWVRQFEKDGLGGLVDEDRPGRPSRMTDAQFRTLDAALRKSPADFGLAGHIWDGKTAAEYIRTKCHVQLGPRQCQRLFRRLGFRFRKPRSMIAHSDPVQREAEKKTP